MRYYLVSESELESMRAGFASGQFDIEITPTTFDVAAYVANEKSVAAEVAEFKAKQRVAMDKMLVAEAESLAELAAAAAAAGKDAAAAAASGADDEDDESAFDKPGFIKVGGGLGVLRLCMPFHCEVVRLVWLHTSRPRVVAVAPAGALA